MHARARAGGVAGAGQAGRAGGQVPGRGAPWSAAAGHRGRAVGAAKAAGGRGPDMDKLKKVLSGQDAEDRSGLSEVGERGQRGPGFARAAGLRRGTATVAAAGTERKAWPPSPPRHPLRRTWGSVRVVGVGPGAPAG